MGISTHPFGGLVLTGDDAIMFVHQVSRGPRAVTTVSIEAGIALSRKLADGQLTLSLPARSA